MRLKITFTILFLNFIGLALFAQSPLVYDKENTGARFTPPPLPSLNELPVVDPLPDPFIWANGKGRSTKFSDWERRRNEITRRGGGENHPQFAQYLKTDLKAVAADDGRLPV